MALYNEQLCGQLVELQRAVPQFSANTPRYLISSGFSVALLIQQEHRLPSDIDPLAFDEIIGRQLIQAGYRDTFYPPYRMPSGLKVSPDLLRDSSVPAFFNYRGREHRTQIVHPAITTVQKAKHLLQAHRPKDSQDLAVLLQYRREYPSETSDWDGLITLVTSHQEGAASTIEKVIEGYRINRV